MDQGRNSQRLGDPLSRQIFALLSDRQRRAIEGAGPYIVASVTGSVRSSNEDVALLARLRPGSRTRAGMDVGIVCDGMGGMRQGRLAAQLAASAFTGAMLRQSPSIALSLRTERALQLAQATVFQELRGEGGTTLSAVCMEGRNACLAHVGDSRVYEIGDGGRLTQLTRDDTLGVALNRGPDDQQDSNRLIQFVGMETDREGGPLEPQIVAISESIPRQGFLITSDGAHSAGHEFLSKISAHSRSPAELARKLLAVADALGGLDNASVTILPDIVDEADEPQSVATMSLISPTGEWQAWLPSGSLEGFGALQEEAPQEHPARGDQVEAPAPRAAPSPSGGQRGQARAGGGGKSKAKKKRPAPTTDALPLSLDGEQPKLSVQFPDDEEGSA